MKRDLLNNLRNRVPENEFKLARWATDDEALLIYFLLQEHRIGTYVECGTANGFTACWAAAAMLDAQIGAPLVYTYDIHNRPKVWDKFQDIKQELSYRITFCQQPYHEAIKGHYPTVYPTCYFIDGDHSRGAVRQDWEATEPKIGPSDIVIFHDVLGYSWIGELFNNLTLSDKYKGSLITTPRGVGVLCRT